MRDNAGEITRVNQVNATIIPETNYSRDLTPGTTSSNNRCPKSESQLTQNLVQFLIPNSITVRDRVSFGQ